jgi:hypothetical protein
VLAVLAMHRLLGHPERCGDVLPGPTERPRPFDLGALELLGEAAEGGNGGKPDRGVAARRVDAEFLRSPFLRNRHAVSISCHARRRQQMLTTRARRDGRDPARDQSVWVRRAPAARRTHVRWGQPALRPHRGSRQGPEGRRRVVGEHLGADRDADFVERGEPGEVGRHVSDGPADAVGRHHRDHP